MADETDPHWRGLTAARADGRLAADAWIEEHGATLTAEAQVELRALVWVVVGTGFHAGYREPQTPKDIDAHRP